MNTITITNVKGFINVMENFSKLIQKSSINFCNMVRIKSDGKMVDVSMDAIEYFAVKHFDVVSGDGEFDFAIMPNDILKAVKYWKDETLEISVDEEGKKVTFVCGSKKITVGCDVNSKDFIEFPDTRFDNAVEYTAEKLFNRLKTVEYAISTNESRPIFTGFHFNGNNIEAIDGYRFHRNIDNEVSFPEFTASKIILKAEKLFEKNERIGISANENHIMVMSVDMEFYCRRLVGEFHNIDKSIPLNADYADWKITKNHIDTIKYVSANINDKNKCPLVVDGEKAVIKLSNSTIEDAFDYPATERMGLNYRFLIEGFKAFIGKSVKVRASRTSINIIMNDTDVIGIMPINIKA